MKVYLSGPMTGIKDFNFPTFHAAAAKLREQGHHVFNPAETEPQPSYKDYLRIDLNWIMENAEAIAMLPGYSKSKGAMAELSLANALGLEVLHVRP